MNQSRAQTRGAKNHTSGDNDKRRCCSVAGGELVVEGVDGKLSIGSRALPDVTGSWRARWRRAPEQRHRRSTARSLALRLVKNWQG